ncbi:hypothetical protein HZB07_01410, partial [Candidatus Saganbacteria bacterium]|nr:hypothetical protein [Candidatus Saganbacteria bacterium]
WKLAILFVILFVICPAWAASPYTGLYWINGAVTVGDSGAAANGRHVIFFQQLEGRNILGGWADDTSGPTGLSGRPAEFALNALQDWRLNIQPGNYFLAIPQGEDGFGADPVRVAVSGRGFDTQNIALVKGGGAGLIVPTTRPAFGLPEISNVYIGRRLYQRSLVTPEKPFIAAAQPKIAARAASSFGIVRDSLAMTLPVMSSTGTIAKSYALGAGLSAITAAAADVLAPVDFSVDLYDLHDRLPEGDQDITITAANAFGSTSEVFRVQVRGGKAALIGTPITFPSPLNLATDTKVTFQYTLSQDVPVEMFVFDISGRIVWRKLNNAREEGGSAGINKFDWNLMTDQGGKISAGIYICTLVNKDNGELLGKVKLTGLYMAP